MTELRADDGQANGTRRHRLFFWSLALVVGLLQIWARRHYMNSDGISYLDIATVGAQAGWSGFLNGYWSPLYPILLHFFLGVFHPSAQWESTAVEFLNLAIYLVNLACFEIFLTELLRHREGYSVASDNRMAVPAQNLWTWGYLFFIWASSFWLRPALVTPDLCVAACAYLAMALLLRIHRKSGSWATFALLGAVLGTAYWAKAAMFPLSFVFLVCAFLAGGSVRRALPRAVLALLVFSALAAPLVIGLSKMKHRFSFGETGNINYAEYVNGAAEIDWQGGPPTSGNPSHPTRQLLDDPPVYEFATPLPGSYPPSYDLSYWSDGVKLHFSLRRQIAVVLRALNYFLQMFTRSGAIYAALIALVFMVGRSGLWRSREKGLWQVWLAAYAPFAMYSLVHVESRFVGEFALMLLMALFAGVRLPRLPKQALPRTALVMILAPGIPIAWTAVANIVDIVRPEPFEAWDIVQGLRGLGVQPGSHIGVIGGWPGLYWARLAGVRIIAEVPYPERGRFWSASPEKQREALSKFSEAGAALVVAFDLSGQPAAHGWVRIPGTRCYVPPSAAPAAKNSALPPQTTAAPRATPGA